MLKKVLILAAVGGIAATVVKKLQGGSDVNAGWQSAYEPAPAPARPANPTGSTAPTAAEAAAEGPVDVPPPPVDIPPAKTEVDPLTDPLPENGEA